MHVDNLPKALNDFLDQHREYFKKILDEALLHGMKVIYNKNRFQLYGDHINTCGRHCILRAIMLSHFHQSLYDYIKWMDMIKKYYYLNADEIVSMLIP